MRTPSRSNLRARRVALPPGLALAAVAFASSHFPSCERVAARRISSGKSGAGTSRDADEVTEDEKAAAAPPSPPAAAGSGAVAAKTIPQAEAAPRAHAVRVSGMSGRVFDVPVKPSSTGPSLRQSASVLAIKMALLRLHTQRVFEGDAETAVFLQGLLEHREQDLMTSGDAAQTGQQQGGQVENGRCAGGQRHCSEIFWTGARQPCTFFAGEKNTQKGAPPSHRTVSWSVAELRKWLEREPFTPPGGEAQRSGLPLVAADVSRGGVGVRSDNGEMEKKGEEKLCAGAGHASGEEKRGASACMADDSDSLCARDVEVGDRILAINGDLMRSISDVWGALRALERSALAFPPDVEQAEDVKVDVTIVDTALFAQRILKLHVDGRTSELGDWEEVVLGEPNLVLRVLPQPRLLDVLLAENRRTSTTMGVRDFQAEALLQALFKISDSSGDRWHRFEPTTRKHTTRRSAGATRSDRVALGRGHPGAQTTFLRKVRDSSYGFGYGRREGNPVTDAFPPVTLPGSDYPPKSPIEIVRAHEDGSVEIKYECGYQDEGCKNRGRGETVPLGATCYRRLTEDQAEFLIETENNPTVWEALFSPRHRQEHRGSLGSSTEISSGKDYRYWRHSLEPWQIKFHNVDEAELVRLVELARGADSAGIRADSVDLRALFSQSTPANLKRWECAGPMDTHDLVLAPKHSNGFGPYPVGESRTVNVHELFPSVGEGTSGETKKTVDESDETLRSVAFRALVADVVNLFARIAPKCVTSSRGCGQPLRAETAPQPRPGQPLPPIATRDETVAEMFERFQNAPHYRNVPKAIVFPASTQKPFAQNTASETGSNREVASLILPYGALCGGGELGCALEYKKHDTHRGRKGLVQFGFRFEPSALSKLSLINLPRFFWKTRAESGEPAPGSVFVRGKYELPVGFYMSDRYHYGPTK